MNLQVYLCTSQHFHPVKDPYDPLCLVWIAVEGQYDQVKSKVYRSHNFVDMLNLAHQLSAERQIPLAVISTYIEPELIYRLEPTV
jgi:hypothetical protein